MASILQRLDAEKIGSIVNVGPREAVLIMPFGAHGVFVPPCRLNPRQTAFEVCLVRAAEMFIKPLMEDIEQRLSNKGETWNTVLEKNAKEEELIMRFQKFQRAFCADNEITDERDWIWLAKRYIASNEKKLLA